MKRSVFVATLLFLCPLMSHAQNEFDALRYNTINGVGDAFSTSLGGAHYGAFTGLGSYTINPATMALLKKSTFSFSMANSSQNERTTYLNRPSTFNRDQTGITDGNVAYVFPTIQGSLVVGAGYTQIADYNRTYRVNAFNTENSITDMMANNSFYRNIAYNGLAIDSTNAGGIQSRFRFYDSFMGIDQYAETYEGGRMGEFSLYAATEFQQNMFVGLSVGIPMAQYSYRRTFLERDLDNFYDQFPDDVQSITLEDRINADVSGMYFRLGLLLKATPWLHVGASYQSKTTLTVSETYSSSVVTVFDDGESSASNNARLEGEYEYRIIRPPRLGLGFSIVEINGFSAHFSTDYVDHSRLNFDFGQDLAFAIDQNAAIARRFKGTFNYRTGISYSYNESSTFSLGYVYMDSPRTDMDASRQIISTGGSWKIGKQWFLDVGVQYHVWNDNVQLYGYSQGGTTVSMMANQEVNRIFMNAGVRFTF